MPASWSTEHPRSVRETQGHGVDIDGDLTLARHCDDRPALLEEIEIERPELFERPLDLGHRSGGHLEVESDLRLPQPIDGAEREQIRVGPEEGPLRNRGDQMSLPRPGIDSALGNAREGCRPLCRVCAADLHLSLILAALREKDNLRAGRAQEINVCRQSGDLSSTSFGGVPRPPPFPPSGLRRWSLIGGHLGRNDVPEALQHLDVLFFLWSQVELRLGFSLWNLLRCFHQIPGQG